jgi:hypothetical protein
LPLPLSAFRRFIIVLVVLGALGDLGGSIIVVFLGGLGVLAAC